VEKVCFSKQFTSFAKPRPAKAPERRRRDDMHLAETSSASLYVNSFVTLEPKEIDI
jgi:hypothetical protein